MTGTLQFVVLCDVALNVVMKHSISIHQCTSTRTKVNSEKKSIRAGLLNSKTGKAFLNLAGVRASNEVNGGQSLQKCNVTVHKRHLNPPLPTPFQCWNLGAASPVYLKLSYFILHTYECNMVKTFEERLKVCAIILYDSSRKYISKEVRNR